MRLIDSVYEFLSSSIYAVFQLYLLTINAATKKKVVPFYRLMTQKKKKRKKKERISSLDYETICFFSFSISFIFSKIIYLLYVCLFVMRPSTRGFVVVLYVL